MTKHDSGHKSAPFQKILPRPVSAPLWLALLLAIQFAIILFVYWPSPTPGDGRDLPLLPGIQNADIRTMEIADASGQSITLLRHLDTWIVADTDEFPANALKADETVTKLLAINTSRLVTRTPNSHSRLQVAENDFNRRITLTDAGGTATSVYLGVTAGGSATHVRVAGDDHVYLTNQIAAWEVDPFLSGWINTTYFSIAPTDIREAHIRLPELSVHLVRNPESDANGEWSLLEPVELAQQSLDSTHVTTLLNRLTFVSLQDVLGKSPPAGYTPEDALVHVELGLQPDAMRSDMTGTPVDPTTDDADAPQNQRVVLEFGEIPDDENNGYFVKSTTSEYYVAVSAFTVEHLLDIDLQMLTASPADAASGSDPEEFEFPSFTEQPNEESALEIESTPGFDPNDVMDQP